jgi:hypothetical protein
MILGDKAGHHTRSRRLGSSLCMLTCFTGHAPYEEILEIKCPAWPEEEARIWENENVVVDTKLSTVVLSDLHLQGRSSNIIGGRARRTLLRYFLPLPLFIR